MCRSTWSKRGVFDMKGSLLLSQRAQAYPASGIRKMAALAAQYQDTINLTLG